MFIPEKIPVISPKNRENSLKNTENWPRASDGVSRRGGGKSPANPIGGFQNFRRQGGYGLTPLHISGL